MNELDLAIGALVLISALIGLVRGFVRETLSLASWILAFGVAWLYAEPASGFFRQYIDSPSLRTIAGFTAIFLATLLLATVLSHFLHQLGTKVGLAGPNRSLGFLFGMIRGGIIVAVLVLLAGTTPLPQESWWKQSVLVGYFQSLALTLLDFVPPNIARQFGYS